jgi:hypothetical protein
MSKSYRRDAIMAQKSLSRRDFLKVSAIAAGGVAAANMLGMPPSDNGSGHN